MILFLILLMKHVYESFGINVFFCQTSQNMDEWKRQWILKVNIAYIFYSNSLQTFM